MSSIIAIRWFMIISKELWLLCSMEELLSNFEYYGRMTWPYGGLLFNIQFGHLDIIMRLLQ